MKNAYLIFKFLFGINQKQKKNSFFRKIFSFKMNQILVSISNSKNTLTFATSASDYNSLINNGKIK